MAVVYAKEQWPGREGDDDITRKRTYPRIFEVVSDNITDDATIIAGPGSGVPRLGDQHPSDSGSICINIHAAQDDESEKIEGFFHDDAH